MPNTAVLRQAAQSAIIRAAHQINQGQYPNLESVSNEPKSDCLWHGGGETPEQGVQLVCQLIEPSGSKAWFQSGDRRTGSLSNDEGGSSALATSNRVLQQLINPPDSNKAEITRGGMTLRVGDRIIQLKNNYNREVFN